MSDSDFNSCLCFFFYVSVFILCQIPSPLILIPMCFMGFHYYFPCNIRYGFSPFEKRSYKARGFSSNLMFIFLAKGCRNSNHGCVLTLWPVSPINSRVGSRCTNVNSLFTAKLTQLSYLCKPQFIFGIPVKPNVNTY